MAELENIFKEINSKLSVLISLSLMEKKNLNLRQKISLIADNGVSNAEIAKILGITPVHVAKEKSLAKKGGK